jgi:hypothetical protein
MWHAWETGEEHKDFGGKKKLMGRGDLGDREVEERIILKWIFKTWDGGMS